MTSVDPREEAEAFVIEMIDADNDDAYRESIRKAARAWAILEHESHGCGVGHLAPCDRLAELRAKQ